jgi:hypothetical protein
VGPCPAAITLLRVKESNSRKLAKFAVIRAFVSESSRAILFRISSKASPTNVLLRVGNALPTLPSLEDQFRIAQKAEPNKVSLVKVTRRHVQRGILRLNQFGSRKSSFPERFSRSLPLYQHQK